MKKEFLQSIKSIILGLLIVVGINYAFAAWSAPTSTPTGGNASAPITVSSTSQYKEGGLSIGKTTAPTSSIKLDVSGRVNIDITDDSSIYSGLSLHAGHASWLTGLYVQGMQVILPVSDTQQGKLFSVYDSLSTDNEIFSVDTATATKGVYSKKVSVANNLSVGTNSQTGDYNLYLNGTTNIGRNGSYGFCSLTKNDVENLDKSCPDGTYVSFVNPTSINNGIYIKCKSFDTISSLTGNFCYTQPFTAFISSFSVSGPIASTTLNETVGVYGGTGTTNTFVWKISHNGGNFYTINQNGCGIPNTTSSCSYYVGGVVSGSTYTINATVTDALNSNNVTSVNKTFTF